MALVVIKVKKTKTRMTASIEVKELIHALPIPNDKRTKGRTQQTDTPIAANNAYNSR